MSFSLTFSMVFAETRAVGPYSCELDGRSFWTVSDLQDHKYSEHHRYHGF